MPNRRTTKQVDSAPGDSETEGHILNAKRRMPAEAETEGHILNAKRRMPADAEGKPADTDTEGHGMRAGG